MGLKFVSASEDVIGDLHNVVATFQCNSVSIVLCEAYNKTVVSYFNCFAVYCFSKGPLMRLGESNWTRKRSPSGLLNLPVAYAISALRAFTHF